MHFSVSAALFVVVVAAVVDVVGFTVVMLVVVEGTVVGVTVNITVAEVVMDTVVKGGKPNAGRPQVLRVHLVLAEGLQAEQRHLHPEQEVSSGVIQHE